MIETDPKHLKQYIKTLQKDVKILTDHNKRQDAKIAMLEYALSQIGWVQEYHCTECGHVWEGTLDSTCPVCGGGA